MEGVRSLDRTAATLNRAVSGSSWPPPLWHCHPKKGLTLEAGQTGDRLITREAAGGAWMVTQAHWVRARPQRR